MGHSLSGTQRRRESHDSQRGCGRYRIINECRLPRSPCHDQDGRGHQGRLRPIFASRQSSEGTSIMTMTMTETAEPYGFLEFCKQLGFKASLHNEDRVFTISEWAQAASISERTARELIASGKGPRVV